MQPFDILIVGAGPAGLSLANALAKSPLRVGIVETQSASALAEPAFDGREIALTHRSIHLLEQLGIWEQIPTAEISRLVDARVRNGTNRQSLCFSHRDSNKSELGLLVPNHLIRKAAWSTLQQQQTQPTLLLQHTVTSVQRIPEGHKLTLDDESTLQCRLLVAADSRFSPTRRSLGIRARMHDFGKTMLVARVHHQNAHHHVAQEWFQIGGTLALLPLNGQQCSVVVTQTAPEIEELMMLDADTFARRMEERTEGELGQLNLASSRHIYPLVACWAERFSAPGAALIGDAAVGMHPVTAHGFNLGLQSVDFLQQEILRSVQGRGVEKFSLSPEQLQRYSWRLRRTAFPLYTATNTLVRLYTDDRPPAQFAREALVQLGELAHPFRRLVARSLSAS